mmetsp:Transcript_12939/g.20483  ORF Transcript_12939/g.20483 Transcript_12939/m.20483 type:complete len:83 (-) Transcript_12939:1583-1831(-)
MPRPVVQPMVFWRMVLQSTILSLHTVQIHRVQSDEHQERVTASYENADPRGPARPAKKHLPTLMWERKKNLETRRRARQDRV